jgi:site-specific DNA-methyltransferase (adenine-specific)
MKENNIICGNCVGALKEIPDESIDLVVTSPPYDKLRKYKGYEFDFEEIAQQLLRVVKKGGVVVWVVGDATVRGSETGSSFRQALHFKDIGFNLHDTMIYQKNSLPKNHRRYEQDFEYMFILSKGKPKTFNPIKVKCKFPEKPTARQNSYFSETDEINRSARSKKKRYPVKEYKIKGNIWKYLVGKNHSTKDKDAFKHPAIFPERLAEDHILSWSNEGDVVLDPMCGSGTTCKMAAKNNRAYIGIDVSEEYCAIARERIRRIIYEQNISISTEK